VRALEVGGEVDVIVIARGGGSVEDLLPFSDEGLIRAVHACSVPVVSAIGHEQDTPLLDLVADVRASTPTGAAEAVVPDVREESMRVAAAREQARLAVHRHISQQAQILDQLRSRPVLTNPASMIDGHQQVVHEAVRRARRDVRHLLERESDAIGHHVARVRSLSPLATLERGYAVAQRPDGTVITTLEQVPEEFAVRLSDGSVGVRTESRQEIPHG
jgi:exodeoxyribonuclease VII large subunit